MVTFWHEITKWKCPTCGYVIDDKDVKPTRKYSQEIGTDLDFVECPKCKNEHLLIW